MGSKVTGRNALRDLSKVRAYVGIALTLMLLIATTSCKAGKPWHGRSIEHYATAEPTVNEGSDEK